MPASGGSGPLVWMLAGIGVLALVALGLVGWLAVFGGDDGDAVTSSDASSNPTTSLTLRGAPTDDGTDEPVVATDPVETPAPSATDAPVATEPPAATTTAPPVSTSTTSTTTTSTTSTTTTTSTPPEDDVPESKAVVRDGQIFLEGAVPDVESGEAIAALAAEILGPDNVFNNYIVDPRAGDPNLGNVTVEDTINFATGSAVILPEGEPLLNQGLALMTIRPAMTVTIVGHTDSRGSDEYNLELSLQRAESVKTWFTDRGVDGDRLTVVGKGESEPLADNDTAEGQRINRRIQFFLENILGDA